MNYDSRTFDLSLDAKEWHWKMKVGKGRVVEGTAPRELNDDEAHSYAVKYVEENWDELTKNL